MTKMKPLLALLLLLYPVGVGLAQEREERIEEVRIVGNRRIREDTIRFYIQSKANDPYNEETVLRDYRSLLGTNFFEDATLLKQQGDTGVIVVFRVTERPLIRSVEYEGMSSFKESDVLEKFRDTRVGLTVDTPFDESRLPRARKAIKSLLDENGRPLGFVEVDVERLTSTTVGLRFRIDEGPKVRIGRIDFEGNTVLGSGALRGALELNKARSIMTVFKGQDKFIKEKLEYDVHVNMLDKYKEIGYIDAKAGETKVEIVEGPRGLMLGFRKTKQQYYLTVPIEEGEVYTYGTFAVEGIEKIPQLAPLLTVLFDVEEGRPVNIPHIRDTVEELKKLYSEQGYLDVEAFPRIEPRAGERIADITIEVTEGEQYIVNTIEFAGNTKTRDKVLRREFFLEEKRQFNGRLLDSSVLRLNQLGFFEPIEEEDYEVIKRPRESQVDVVINVKERSQQSIGFTGGVSGISGSFVGINYSSNNFRGLGQRVEVSLTSGTRTNNFSLSFTDPAFRDSPMTVSWSVFKTLYRFDTFAASFGLSAADNVRLYDRNTTGFSVGASYPLFRWTRAGLRYSFQSISIDGINETFTNFALNQLRGFTPGGSIEDARNGIPRSEITPNFRYNTKNRFYGATAGSSIQVEVPIAGGPLGGKFNIIRPFVELQHFRPEYVLSGGRNTLAFRLRLQHILPYGSLDSGAPMTIPFFERVWAGGEFDLRGFRLRSVSPWAISRSPTLDSSGNPIIDLMTGLPLISENPITVGGDTLAVGTIEYRMPIVGPLEVAAFADVGTSTVLNKSSLQLFGPDTVIDLLENTNSVLRASVGAEVRFLMPVINQPFRLIFAYNPMILDTDIIFRGRRVPLMEERSNVQFSVGYNF